MGSRSTESGAGLKTACRAYDAGCCRFPLRAVAEHQNQGILRASNSQICKLSSTMFQRCLRGAELSIFIGAPKNRKILRPSALAHLCDPHATCTSGSLTSWSIMDCLVAFHQLYQNGTRRFSNPLRSRKGIWDVIS